MSYTDSNLNVTLWHSFLHSILLLINMRGKCFWVFKKSWDSQVWDFQAYLNSFRNVFCAPQNNPKTKLFIRLLLASSLARLTSFVKISTDSVCVVKCLHCLLRMIPGRAINPNPELLYSVIFVGVLISFDVIMFSHENIFMNSYDSELHIYLPPMLSIQC